MSLHKKSPLEPLTNRTWRAFTTIVILAMGVSVVLVPLVLLIPLLVRGADPANTTEHSLLWLWITMTVVEMALALFIIWSMFRTAFGIWQSTVYRR
jgi:hypothetical protein